MVRGLGLVFAVGWGLFWLYWVAAAFSKKRSRVLWSRTLGIRAVLVIIVIVLVHAHVLRHPDVNTNVALAALAPHCGHSAWASRSGPG